MPICWMPVPGPGDAARSGCCPRISGGGFSSDGKLFSPHHGRHCPRRGCNTGKDVGRRPPSRPRQVRSSSVPTADAPGRAQFGVTLQGYDVETRLPGRTTFASPEGLPHQRKVPWGCSQRHSGSAPRCGIAPGAGKDVPRQRLCRRFTAGWKADRNGGAMERISPPVVARRPGRNPLVGPIDPSRAWCSRRPSVRTGKNKLFFADHVLSRRRHSSSGTIETGKPGRQPPCATRGRVRGIVFNAGRQPDASSSEDGVGPSMETTSAGLLARHYIASVRDAPRPVQTPDRRTC